jgi:hypothetical protein
MANQDKLYTNAGLRDLNVTSSAGECAGETKQLKGEATKDSLYGTNSTVEYSTSLSVEGLGKMGGKPNFG